MIIVCNKDDVITRFLTHMKTTRIKRPASFEAHDTTFALNANRH